MTAEAKLTFEKFAADFKVYEEGRIARVSERFHVDIKDLYLLYEIYVELASHPADAFSELQSQIQKLRSAGDLARRMAEDLEWLLSKRIPVRFETQEVPPVEDGETLDDAMKSALSTPRRTRVAPDFEEISGVESGPSKWLDLLYDVEYWREVASRLKVLAPQLERLADEIPPREAGHPPERLKSEFRREFYELAISRSKRGPWFELPMFRTKKGRALDEVGCWLFNLVFHTAVDPDSYAQMRKRNGYSNPP